MANRTSGLLSQSSRWTHGCPDHVKTAGNELGTWVLQA